MTAVTAPTGFRTFYLGKGKVVHAAQDHDTVTLCKKPITTVRLAHTPYVSCTQCAKVALKMITDAPSDDTKEDDMPANTNPSDATNEDVDGLISDVHATVDQIKELVPGSEGVTGAADALKAEAEGKIRQLPTNKRTALRKAVTDAHKKAVAKPEPEPAPAAPAPASTAIVRQAEDPMEIEGIPDLVKQSVKAFKDGVKYGLKLSEVGETVARTMLEMRLKITNPESGLPDLTAERKTTKNAAGKVYETAREGVAETDTKTKDAHDALAKAVQNKMGDVLVSWLRDFSSSPNPDEALETARLYFPEAAKLVEDGRALIAEGEAQEGDEDVYTDLTEAIYAVYEHAGTPLPRYGRTEIQRFNYRVKQLDTTRKELDAARDSLDDDELPKAEKETLTAKVSELEEKAKGITEEIPAEWLEKATPEKTPKQRAADKVERAKKLTTSVTKAVKKLEGAERQEVSTSLVTLGREIITNATAGAEKLSDDEKADLKSQLESLVTMLAGEAAKL
ncbi:hypothetical protein SEA_SEBASTISAURUS_23 [Streptomyces phage Sebastisaurus]|uniref:Immunity repressor n=1 Tax=Streptomyces phage Sebastisaurus TaxID=2510572 RepID=A0A411B3X4_9CAUD|nr:hypothetical protein SEA_SEBASTISAURUS_23 [Streptomyces phage Sebastisaurus]